MLSQLLRGLLSATVGIDIDGEIDRARTIAQLLKLESAEMRAERAGEVAKPCLPQHGIVEQTLDENHNRISTDLLPAINTPRGSWQTRSGGADAERLRP